LVQWVSWRCGAAAYRSECAMKRRGRPVLLVMLMMVSFVPGSSIAVAQDANLCDVARGANEGTVIDGYTVVYGSGGSGSQIVLGTGGDDVLSGGSGNDVLCAYGGYDVLNGGSGNDVLVNGPGGGALNGGSGNDSLTGYEGDVFAGGSGRNSETVLQNGAISDPAPGPDIWITGGERAPNGTINGSGFTPNVYFGVDILYIGPGFTEYEYVELGYMRADGSFRTIDIFLFCLDRKYLGVTVTSIGIGVNQDDADGVYHYEEFPLSCP
jgi:Ca2+-binding RTX toxin-like protein